MASDLSVAWQKVTELINISFFEVCQTETAFTKSKKGPQKSDEKQQIGCDVKHSQVFLLF
jgi:hypothetical protein